MTRSRTSHRDDEKADVLSLNAVEAVWGGEHRGDHPRTELYLA